MTISEYYWVSCRPFDTPGDGALLSSVLREYFLTGKAAGGSLGAVESGRAVRARYRVGGGSFRWRKMSGRAVLQEAFPLAGGDYRVVSHDPLGGLSSAATFDGSLRWLRTAYYDGDPSKPSAVLLRNGQGISLLDRDPRTDRYVRRELLPCPAEPGTAAQSYIDGAAGEPRVLAQTDAGVFCFCTEGECAARAALREKLAEDADSLTPDWPEEERGAPLDFHVIANGGGGPPLAEAERPPEAEPPEAKPSAEEAPPSAGLPPGDYAADHEIYLPEGGFSPEPISPAPARYAVAAKGLSGEVVRAAKLGSPDAPKRSPGSAWSGTSAGSGLPAGLIPAKRIVVSSLESYQYFGKLLDGLREGQGRTQMLNGHTAYEGGYHEDKRSGFGVYYYKSGKICYAGGWRRNLRDGMGVAFGSKDGSIFVGHWKNGVATGSGSAFDMAGELIYTGGWLGGKRHGHGTEYRGGHILRVGEWKEDRFCSGYSRVEGPPAASHPPAAGRPPEDRGG